MLSPIVLWRVFVSTHKTVFFCCVLLFLSKENKKFQFVLFNWIKVNDSVPLNYGVKRKVNVSYRRNKCIKTWTHILNTHRYLIQLRRKWKFVFVENFCSRSFKKLKKVLMFLLFLVRFDLIQLEIDLKKKKNKKFIHFK